LLTGTNKIILDCFKKDYLKLLPKAFLERMSRETSSQPTLFTYPFQVLSEHALKQKFKPRYS